MTILGISSTPGSVEKDKVTEACEHLYDMLQQMSEELFNEPNAKIVVSLEFNFDD